MRSLGAAMVMLGTLSCFSRAQYDQAHEARVIRINERYSAMRAERTQQWDKLLADIEALKQYLIPISPNAGYSPVDRVDSDNFRTATRSGCEVSPEFKAAHPDAVAAQFEQITRDCYAAVYKDVYIPALERKYYKADIAWVSQEWSTLKGTGDLEALFAYSHNATMLAEIQRQRATVEAALRESLADIDSMRAREIQLSAEQRDVEVAAAQERHRERMQAIAAALQAASQNSSHVTTAPTSGLSATCTSDFTCGIGYACVKNNYASSGYCARVVDAAGAQTFDLPRLDSVMPKFPVSTDCNAIGCPGGFRCDYRSGACLR